MSEKIKYALDGCKRGIRAARQNIKTFQDAIQKEEDTIEQLKYMMEEIERKDKERQVEKITLPIEGSPGNDNKK